MIKINPYWAFIFYLCLKNKNISNGSKQILIKNINKNLCLLGLRIQRIILEDYRKLIN